MNKRVKQIDPQFWKRKHVNVISRILCEHWFTIILLKPKMIQRKINTGMNFVNNIVSRLRFEFWSNSFSLQIVSIYLPISVYLWCQCFIVIRVQTKSHLLNLTICHVQIFFSNKKQFKHTLAAFGLTRFSYCLQIDYWWYFINTFHMSSSKW